MILFLNYEDSVIRKPIIFFKNELLPIIKDVIEELGINMFEKEIIDAEAINIIENIYINLRNKDIIAELFGFKY